MLQRSSCISLLKPPGHIILTFAYYILQYSDSYVVIKSRDFISYYFNGSCAVLFTELGGVFRTLSNKYDGAFFFEKIVNA